MDLSKPWILGVSIVNVILKCNYRWCSTEKVNSVFPGVLEVFDDGCSELQDRNDARSDTKRIGHYSGEFG
jgi:hypothetical protein